MSPVAPASRRLAWPRVLACSALLVVCAQLIVPFTTSITEPVWAKTPSIVSRTNGVSPRAASDTLGLRERFEQCAAGDLESCGLMHDALRVRCPAITDPNPATNPREAVELTIRWNCGRRLEAIDNYLIGLQVYAESCPGNLDAGGGSIECQGIRARIAEARQKAFGAASIAGRPFE